LIGTSELRTVSVKEDKFVGGQEKRLQMTETTVTERQVTHLDDYRMFPKVCCGKSDRVVVASARQDDMYDV